MRQEADYQLSEARQDARSTLQLARDQISTLQQEKRDLLSRFEQTRSNEAKLNNAQTTSSTERDGLQQQLTELRAAKDAETLSIRADAAEKNQKLTDSHRTDIGDWSRRLTQTSAALKEKEAEVRRFREESRLKLNSDRRVAETKLLQVEQSYRKQLEEAKAQSSRDQQQASQSSVVDETPSRPLQNIHAGKNRKKVSRQNHSMLNVAGDSNTQSDYAVGPSQITQTEVSQTRREAPKVYQSLFEEDAGAEELLDEFSLSLVNREVEQVPETQEFGGLSMSLDDFDQRINQASHHPTKHQNTSSTDLSIISSDEMDQIQRDAQPMSTLMLRGYDRSSSKHNDAMETPMRSDNVSVSDSHSSHSHDRPRSQANTASRLMPPPGNVSHHSQPRDQSQGAGAKVASRRPMYEKIGQKLNSNGKSSPDFMHPPSSASKHTYGQHDTRNSARNEPRPSTPQAMEQSHTQKRKSSNSRTERETTVKKQRTSSQSYPTISPSGSRSQSPYLTRPSVVGSRLKTQTGLSYAQDPSLTATSRSKTQASSSSVPPRASSRLPSSSEMYSSCRQQPSSSQVQGAGPTRRTSSRLKKRSKSNLIRSSKLCCFILTQSW
ncbi:hypothetical protein EJ02DRAFT_353412 [Clathrospora elynae]|uniref:Uncharacterized protein n=1 Tax=Clathrospora elynae TaxID=706981 RepID=A0A6A5SE73_9PLEO|nr:hypothetical protein EJ02DRAFT_353412 [Clathrospora elynae]